MTTKQPTPNINLTPLIDVLLVLLIIFMVITPLKPHKLETKLPEKPSPELDTAPPDPGLLFVNIDNAGQVSINREDTTLDKLSDLLNQELNRRPANQRTVYVRAPRNLPYEMVVGVIDQIKISGAMPIGLVIDYLDEK